MAKKLIIPSIMTAILFGLLYLMPNTHAFMVQKPEITGILLGFCFIGMLVIGELSKKRKLFVPFRADKLASENFEYSIYMTFFLIAVAAAIFRFLK
jgi:hypothetical protein